MKIPIRLIKNLKNKKLTPIYNMSISEEAIKNCANNTLIEKYSYNLSKKIKVDKNSS